MISKTVLVFGNKEIMVGACLDKDSGLPVISFSDFGCDISGENLQEIDATATDEVLMLIGSKESAKVLRDAFQAALTHWEDQEDE